jgi:hypothetical protein
MASRGDKKRRYRDEQMHATLRASQEKGHYDVSFALQSLPRPDREFYANTGKVLVRSNYVTFFFGQFHPGHMTSIENAVVIDIPHRTFGPLVASFDDGFRAKVLAVTQALAPMDRYIQTTKEIQSLTFASHVARLLINDFSGVVDFFELVPALGRPPAIEPVIRIKSLPSVVRWFVDACDELVKEAAVATSKPEPENETP